MYVGNILIKFYEKNINMIKKLLLITLFGLFVTSVFAQTNNVNFNLNNKLVDDYLLDEYLKITFNQNVLNLTRGGVILNNYKTDSIHKITFNSVVTSIDNKLNTDFDFYPNPIVDGFITIKSFYWANHLKSVKVIDSHGNECLIKLVNPEINRQNMEIILKFSDNISSGLYLVMLESDSYLSNCFKIQK